MSHPGAVMNHNGPDKQQQQQPQLVSRQHESNLFMKLLINRLGIQVGGFFFKLLSSLQATKECRACVAARSHGTPSHPLAPLRRSNHEISQEAAKNKVWPQTRKTVGLVFLVRIKMLVRSLRCREGDHTIEDGRRKKINLHKLVHLRYFPLLTYSTLNHATLTAVWLFCRSLHPPVGAKMSFG